MNQIRFAANPDTNYVFHMLSVARVGYDNAYGAAFRADYPAEDLAVLKSYEDMLTVRGGEHCGVLYHMMVVLPARAEQSAREFYAALLDEAINGPVPPDAEVYRPIVADICRVMIRHYDDFISRIWPGQEEAIRRYIPQVAEKFTASDFAARAEAMVGCGLPGEGFTATMVTSVENGAEAIDISPELAVFSIVRHPLDAFYFIGHEFIIYLLKNALKDEDAFQSFATWPITEGMAEYYLKRILGDTRFFNAQRNVVAFLEGQNANLPAVELYRLACDEFIA